MFCNVAGVVLILLPKLFASHLECLPGDGFLVPGLFVGTVPGGGSFLGAGLGAGWLGCGDGVLTGWLGWGLGGFGISQIFTLEFKPSPAQSCPVASARINRRNY